MNKHKIKNKLYDGLDNFFCN